MIEIYTDGSCDPNPGPGGWAVIVVRDGKEVTRISGRADCTTNNAMELRALLEAAQFAKGGPATIYSDSQYALNCLKWAVGWKARGWRKADGKEIANLDLVKALHAADLTHFRWTWVRGHNGNKWNEAADRLAEQARLAAPPPCDHAIGEKYDPDYDDYTVVRTSYWREMTADDDFQPFNFCPHCGTKL